MKKLVFPKDELETYMQVIAKRMDDLELKLIPHGVEGTMPFCCPISGAYLHDNHIKCMLKDTKELQHLSTTGRDAVIRATFQAIRNAAKAGKCRLKFIDQEFSGYL